MKFKHNQICTKNNEVIVGGKYQYYESIPLIIMDVEVLEDTSDSERIEFVLKPLKIIAGSSFNSEPFTIMAARGNYAYSGMWRLYDLGEYVSA